ncbi:MAG: BON domain-containing protein [Holosporales bacterium]|nr:BON domain-containing protein [Holosporales bacterium]
MLILLIANISAFLTGCVPVMVGTGVVTGGYLLCRDKKFGDSINDTEIEAKIKKKLYSINPVLYSDASVMVDHGCVLLTGIVHESDWINLAEKEAWATNGVVSVDNCLSYGKGISASQLMKDGIITSSCRAAILCTPKIKSINFKIKTMDGGVYLIGLAESNEERDLVLSKAQNISGVKKILSFIRVAKKQK